MKAMILAAGRGERLRPLTLTTPKPLLKIDGVALIDHVLQSVRAANITDVVINVYYLKEQIMQHCGDGSTYDLHIQYSTEETLLETGGGILNALPLLGDSPFLVLSADVWTNYSLLSLTQKKINAAHLVFVKNPDYHAKGDFGLDKNNIVCADAAEKFTYANIGILHPCLFHNASPGIFPLRQVLLPAIARGEITGEVFCGEWHNIGTVKDLNYANTFANHF